MKRLPFFCLWVLLCLPPSLGADVATLRLNGPIDTLAQEYLVGTLRQLQSTPQIHLIVIQLDTPGGYDTSMRVIIQEMLAAKAPVAVLVSPRGARAASAGFFLMLAADITAMAPGTNAGAASPVSAMGGEIEKTMKAKVTNDAAAYIRSLARSHRRDEEWAAKAVLESLSYTAEECLERGLIDLVAADVPSLLAQLEDREVTRPDGSRSTLRLKGERIVPYPMSPRQRFLRMITNPGLAYFLLIFGLIGLYIEFTHPGTIIPGVLGGICLLLAFLAFQILPVNFIGLLLILLSIGFFVAEIKVQGFGVLGVGGIASFILGSIVLVRSPIAELRPAMSIILTFAVCFAAVVLFLAWKAARAMGSPVRTGVEGMIGETGIAKTEVTPAGGPVFVHGEWWRATAKRPIAPGTPVVVSGVNRMSLTVTQGG